MRILKEYLEQAQSVAEKPKRMPFAPPKHLPVIYSCIPRQLGDCVIAVDVQDGTMHFLPLV